MTEHHNLIAQREDSNSIIYKSQAVFLYIVPVIYIIGHIRHVRYVGDFSVVLNVVWYQLCFISPCWIYIDDTNRQYKETIDWCISKSYTMLITVCRLSWSNSAVHSITSMITLRHSCIYQEDIELLLNMAHSTDIRNPMKLKPLLMQAAWLFPIQLSVQE